MDWMVATPFRASSLPLALFAALDLRLPPAAMWIHECVIEQELSSKVQRQYLRHYGRLARLPVPLFVYELADDQVTQYADVVRGRLSDTAFAIIEPKLRDGLGIEVYYYPTLPVRASDLFVREIRHAFAPALSLDTLESTF